MTRTVTRTIRHNLHLLLLAAAILAGAVLETHDHRGDHVACKRCLDQVEAS